MSVTIPVTILDETQGYHFEALVARINQLRQMALRLDQIKSKPSIWSDPLKSIASSIMLYGWRLCSFSQTISSAYTKRSAVCWSISMILVIWYDAEIDDGSSEAISKMKIFCYDLMLVSFARKRWLGIDFLIYDSTINMVFSTSSHLTRMRCLRMILSLTFGLTIISVLWWLTLIRHEFCWVSDTNKVAWNGKTPGRLEPKVLRGRRWTSFGISQITH